MRLRSLNSVAPWPTRADLEYHSPAPCVKSHNGYWRSTWIRTDRRSGSERLQVTWSVSTSGSDFGLASKINGRCFSNHQPEGDGRPNRTGDGENPWIGSQKKVYVI